MKNILQSAISIQNDNTCLYDTNYGYNCTFTDNGDVAGWDVYDNIYLYGCWSKALFGTSNTTTCYIGRTENIRPVVAEDYPIFRMMLKITAPENPYKSPPTQGKIQWKTSADDYWDDNKSEVFELASTESWFLCDLAMDGHQYWSNHITDLRITLFENGYEGISFAIRYIRLVSKINFTCLNTQCSYYDNYSHPCKGVGAFSTATANISSDYYTTVSGVSDSLVVNIDGYGDECVNIGTNNHLSGTDIAKKITGYLNRIDIGSYAYSTVEYTEENKLKIVSGNLLTTATAVSLDMGTEFTLYIHAYSMSAEFASLLDSSGISYWNPVAYLYVIYGDIAQFIELVYGDFLVTNTSYYTTISSLSDTLTAAGYFKDILIIKASDNINMLSVCNDLYDYSTVIYPEFTTVYMTASKNNIYATASVFDVTNDKTITNFDDPFVLVSLEINTKSLKLINNSRNYVVNYIFFTLGDVSVPIAEPHSNYAYKSTNHIIEKVSSVWLSETFNLTIEDSVGENIVISGGTAAEVLGFYTDDAPNYTQTCSSPPASGFDFASARKLRYFEIAKLINNDFESLGYYHNPDQPVVDAGRRDYFESLAANTKASSNNEDYYTKLDGAGKIIIDFTHPISDCGRLNNIKIGGSVSAEMVGEVLIFRPYKDGTLTCLESFTIVEANEDYVYSSNVSTNYLYFDILVSKGDLIGFKNIDLLCIHSSKTNLPNAALFVIPSTTDVTTNFNPGSLVSQGVIGPSYYAYSNRIQDSVKLTIDVGKRLNVDKFQIYGQEFGDFFEYNLAACLDVDWKCNLFGDNHTHLISYPNSAYVTHTHQNRCYGLDSLSDCSVTADGGQEGTSFARVEGLATYGPHSYFYVNGDAEWLNGPRGCMKSEYSYPYGAVNTENFEHDPIALYLTIPENKSVDLYKASVYFKEAPNYKKMSASYFLGSDSVGGNSDVVGYQYIEDITSVSLDGIAYYPEELTIADGNYTISNFVTENPLPDSRLSKVNGVILNWELYNLAENTQWNVFEYNFKSVNAYGFMLYSDWHVSTKIMEIELYSGFSIVPTLLDNITVMSSIYGETWETLVFEYDTTNSDCVSAFVSNSPRYFKLSIEPQDIFKLYEISVSLDESGVGALNCVDSIVPVEAVNGKMSSIQEIIVENIYDVPLHLYVNIPKIFVSSNNLLSWIKLSSEETTVAGEIGPGAVVHKNFDFPLVAYDNQVAINCPSYYLKNLIGDKKAYIYEYNSVWREFGNLVDGQDIGYSNVTDGYFANFAFDLVASRYWKIVFGDCVARVFNAYSLLFGELVVKPNAVYIQSEVGETSNYKIPLSFDLDGNICDTTVFSYSFSNKSYLNYWGVCFDSDVYFMSDEVRGFYPLTMVSGGIGTLSASLPYSSNSFKTVVDFMFFPTSYLTNYVLRIDLQDNEYNSILCINLTSNNTHITMAAWSYNPDSSYVSDDYSAYYDGDYGSTTITREQANSVFGKFRLVVKKTSKVLDYIKVTDRAEITTYCTIIPDRTYFSSRLSNISFTVGNTTPYNLPAALSIPRLIYSNVRAVIIDCVNNYGSVTYMGLRSIEFFNTYGQLITLTNGTNFSAFNTPGTGGVSYRVFDTSILKTGHDSNNGLKTSNGVVGEVRLICLFDDLTTFSEFCINNSHYYGTNTDIGVKDVKVYITNDAYIDTTYGAEVSNGILIYDGSFKQHVLNDVEDTEYITTSGVGELVSIYENSTDLYVGVESVNVFARPIINNLEALVFEFDSVTPLNSINITTAGTAMDQTILMISDQRDEGYEIWARNSTKFRMTEGVEATFVDSGFYTCRNYRGYLRPLYSFYAMYRDNITLYSVDTSFFASVGQLPLWCAYDFGQGNECRIDALWFVCYKTAYAKLSDGSYDTLPDIADTIQIYGSNDTGIDWANKPKDLLTTVSGCYNLQPLYLELQTTKPYRYYCLYAPNLEQSTEDYSLSFKKLTLYSYLDDIKKEYTFSYDDNIKVDATDLYYDSNLYVHSAIDGPWFFINLNSMQYVSGIKARIYYISSFENYAHLEYSTDSTNGTDGTWLTIAYFSELVTYYDSYGEELYYTLTFPKAIYATWLRIVYQIPYTNSTSARFYDFMPILGEISSSLIVTNHTYDNYFVIDLYDVYSLDFIRNYGDSNNLLNLFNIPIFVGEKLITNEESTTEQVITYEYFVFNSAGEYSWKAHDDSDVVVDVLIVAGGGAGGNTGIYGAGGGGGAGGLLIVENVTFIPGADYILVVGAGGVGKSENTPGENGENSSVFGYTVIGGGGGGGGCENFYITKGSPGQDGGSGGGSSSANHIVGVGVVNQGNSGGIGNGHSSYQSYLSGGGGGGAGTDGVDSYNGRGGNGGTGISSDISGQVAFYGGGGGGACYDTYTSYGAGGSNIGGAGSRNIYYEATSGRDGTGSGGGGKHYTSSGLPGSGGCGVIIIRCKKVYTQTFDTTNQFNSDIDTIKNISWENYTINSNIDARWLRLPLTCGDGQERVLQYLGIYPDISKAYKKYGGFNCEWKSVGVGLTDYSYSLNVAPQAELYYGDIDILNDVKTVIIDIGDGYGYNAAAIAGIELYDGDGVLIDLSYNVFQVYDTYTPRASSSNGTNSLPENAFNVANPTTGYMWGGSCWISASNVNTNIRVSCVLNTSVTLSKIVIQNGHSDGGSTTIGVKTVSIWVSSAEITSVTFADFPYDSLLVFYGDIPKHIDKDIEDRYVIDLVNFSLFTANYFSTYLPSKCIQGDSTLTGYDNSWGFKAEAKYPILELKLDAVYNVRTFKITHSPDDSGYFVNTSYKIFGKLEQSSEYTQLFYITNNSNSYAEHVLDEASLMRFVKLEIISYESDDNYYYYDVDEEVPVLIDGGFLREFEIWTDDGHTTLNSEEHPVVCVNLLDQYIVTSHELVLLKEIYTDEDFLWNNSDEFFSYSDTLEDEPQKVSFMTSSGDVGVYSTSDDYLDYSEIVFSLLVEGNLYLVDGTYILKWDSYNAMYDDSITIELIGPETIKLFNENIASSWVSQVSYFSIANAGYYNIYTKRYATDIDDTWGVRNVAITKSTLNTKWVALKRDTATNHAWTNTDVDYGIDYISRLRIYASSSYIPTEFPWFWSSTISTISREHANTKESSYALRVEYPTASGVDRLDFLEGDHFGWDENWSVKDSLSFWWFISDLDNLYIDEGGFGFGSFSGADSNLFIDKNGLEVNMSATQAYYLWDFKDMDLKTGWNEVTLQFDKSTCTAPLQTSSSSRFDSELNFRNNFFTSFGMVYKGKGAPFYMLFDGLKIKRNKFNDTIVDDKGLCLTWKEYADIPVSGITLYRGTVEFWVKPYTSTGGYDIFGEVRSRVLFTLTNNYDELLCLTIKSSGWFEIGFGGARYGFNTLYLDPNEYDLSSVVFDIGEPFHIAVAWSSFGIDMDNSDTIRLYINNDLIITSQKTWEVSDTKSSLLRLGGGSSILSNNNDEEGSAIFNHVKVYDYCKDFFPLETHLPNELNIAQENEPTRVSKDGAIFHDYDSSELPLKYEEVLPGEKVKIYTRIDKTNKQRKSDSGTLDIDWEVIV